jgi:hypothetical protein
MSIHSACQPRNPAPYVLQAPLDPAMEITLREASLMPGADATIEVCSFIEDVELHLCMTGIHLLLLDMDPDVVQVDYQNIPVMLLASMYDSLDKTVCRLTYRMWVARSMRILVELKVLPTSPLALHTYERLIFGSLLLYMHESDIVRIYPGSGFRVRRGRQFLHMVRQIWPMPYHRVEGISPHDILDFIQQRSLDAAPCDSVLIFLEQNQKLAALLLSLLELAGFTPASPHEYRQVQYSVWGVLMGVTAAVYKHME